VAWRVVLLADVPNLVLASGALVAPIAEMNPLVESREAVQRQITLTVAGADALDAGASAIRALERALGGLLAGTSVVEAVQQEADDPLAHCLL
jgi:hypothetical protein